MRFMWQIVFSSKADKMQKKLPLKIRERLLLLISELEEDGPIAKNWQHYGKLKGKDLTYHCHLKHGKPVYVACWEVLSKKEKLIEVYYVGTHEKAPY